MAFLCLPFITVIHHEIHIYISIYVLTKDTNMSAFSDIKK